MDVLHSLGIHPIGSPPPLPHYRVRIGGQNHRLPSGPATLARTRALSGRGKAQFAALLATLGRTDARRLEGVSVNTWLAGRDLTPSADAIMRVLVRISTYSAEFDTFAADAAVRQLQTAVRGGVLYLDGGWSQLIDALSALVEVRAQTAVRGIEPGAGGIEVLTDDERFVAKSVVVALGNPKATRALLPGDPGGARSGRRSRPPAWMPASTVSPLPAMSSVPTMPCTPRPSHRRLGRRRRGAPSWLSCAMGRRARRRTERCSTGICTRPAWFPTTS
jgi:phytoene dehydrogenase-like protein